MMEERIFTTVCNLFRWEDDVNVSSRKGRRNEDNFVWIKASVKLMERLWVILREKRWKEETAERVMYLRESFFSLRVN